MSYCEGMRWGKTETSLHETVQRAAHRFMLTGQKQQVSAIVWSKRDEKRKRQQLEDCTKKVGWRLQFPRGWIGINIVLMNTLE